LDFFERNRDRFGAHITAEDYPIYISKLITSRVDIDPDNVSSYLEIFFNRCDHLLRVFKYSEMPALAEQLEKDLRQVKLTHARPTEAAVTASRGTIHSHGQAQGWVSAEIDAAEKLAEPSRIGTITWRGLTTNDGREISRESVRSSLRYAAYSDEKWGEYLASLPKIQAPSEDPR
jgi:hypothetical protein